MAIHNDGGGGDDSEDDDDIVVGVGENFRRHIDALKRACVLEVGHGGYISTPASILSGETPPPACEEEEDEEEENDDELFLSIQNKYGAFGYGDSPWFGKGAPRDKKPGIVASEAEEDDEEEDDEEILRSVENLYKSGVGSRQQEALLPEVVSPLKEGSEADAPRGDEKTHPSPSQHPSPGFEPGGNEDGEDGGFSPGTRSETGVEPGEQVARSITSFLPGNWIDTDGDVEYGNASPAGPLEMVAIERGDNDTIAVLEETKEYSRPEHALVLTDALKKNRQCQRTLRNLLSQVEAKQKENAELQKRVRSLVDFEKYCNRRFAGFFTDQANPSVKLIAAKALASQPKSSDSINKTVSDLQTCGPPENPDVEIFKMLQKKVSFTFQTRRWSNEERTELSKGVKQQVFEVLVRQAMATLSNVDALDEEFSSLDDHMSKIGGKEFTPQQIRDSVPGIDWAQVARVYVVGRTPEECRTRWINHEDSLINKRSWKKMEDKKLLSIAQQHNFCTWEQIADQLGTHRTPAECLTRYQRSLNASIMRSNWTPEEDSRLRAAVEEWGENDWSAVSACLQGRNNSQCLMRWYKVLHPTKKKRGRWSVEEDKRLKWAVSVYGPKKWKQIAEHVPGRTDLQCRERWCNVLDPSIKLGEWTEDEDRILEESVARHGPHRWAAVANDLKIRTDNQCCRRWKFLHPEDQPEFQRTVHIRRTALVGNFQGRKKERPRLGPQDFISKGTDFEVYARKATGKRAVKEKEKPRSQPRRKGPIESNGDSAAVQSVGFDGPRERRAARILKRRLAKARKASNDERAQIIASTPDALTDNEFMDVLEPHSTFSQLRPDAVHTESTHIDKSGQGMKRKADRISDPIDPCNRSKRTKRNASHVADAIDRSNGSGKGRKRKATEFADPVDPGKRTKLTVRRLSQSVGVSRSQDTSREAQSVGPEIFSFLDLVQSLESYCKYCCLLAKEENRSEIFSNGSETQGSYQIESNTDPLLVEVRDKDSCQRGEGMLDQDNLQFSKEDEEVASATRAVLSWPFFRGVQEHWSQGTIYLGSLGGIDLGSQGMTDLGSSGGKDMGSQGTTDLGSKGTTDLGSKGTTDLRSQGTTNLRSQGVTDLASRGTTELRSEGTTDSYWGSRGNPGLGSQGLTALADQGMTNLGSRGTTDLGPQWMTVLGSQGTTDLRSQGVTDLTSQGTTNLGSQGRTGLGSQGKTDLGYRGLTEPGSKGTTYSKSQVSCQNAAKMGTKESDSFSIPSIAVKKPRSKRPVRMRGAMPWEKSDKRWIISPMFRPWLSTNQRDQDDNS